MAPAPVFKEKKLLTKLANVLELLDNIEAMEKTFKLLESESMPVVDPRLFEKLEAPPGSDCDPIAHLAMVDLNQMSREFESGIGQNLKRAKELLRCDYRFLLKVLLVSGGVTTITPKLPRSEVDEKVLEMLGLSLIGEQQGSKENAEAKVKKAVRNVNIPVPEPSSSSAVGEWMKRRAAVFGEHLTTCIDRTIRAGTEQLFSHGLSRISGGRMKLLIQDKKGLEIALQGSKSNAGNSGESVKGIVQALKAKSKGAADGEVKGIPVPKAFLGDFPVDGAKRRICEIKIGLNKSGWYVEHDGDS